MKYTPIVSLLVGGLLLSACGGKKEDPKKNQKQPPPIVDVIIAKTQAVSNNIEVNGTVVPEEFAELHPEISGIVTYLNVQEGSPVSKGTVIARINNADLVSQLNKLKVQLDLARITEQRYKKLVDIQGINRADYDAAVNQVSSLQADISAQQVLIGRSIIRAPFSGVLGLRQISPGAYVSPTSIVATIQKVDKLKIDFTVPEEYAGAIARGKYVRIKTDTATQAQQQALIIATEPQANASTRNLTVRALLENGKVQPGGFVKVQIDAGNNKNSVMVPSNAIIPEDMNKSLVVVKNGKASFVKVQTGVRQENLVEITSGIAEGDSVVVTGVLFTRPNAPVKVRSVKKLEDFK